MANLSNRFQVIAIDLPGYGKSAKSMEDSYSFRYYERVLTDFLNVIKIEDITLGVHDVGGPVGLYWMTQNMERVSRLILFNTIVFPQFSWAVKLFGIATRLPIIREWLTSPKGIKSAMHFGVYQKEKLTEEIISNYQSPFVDQASRKALLRTVQNLSLKGFTEIEEKLVLFNGPVQIIYGKNDRILPNVGITMKRVKEILPQSEILAIPNCGHFLQEDYPGQISDVIEQFMTT